MAPATGNHGPNVEQINGPRTVEPGKIGVAVFLSV